MSFGMLLIIWISWDLLFSLPSFEIDVLMVSLVTASIGRTSQGEKRPNGAAKWGRQTVPPIGERMVHDLERNLRKRAGNRYQNLGPPALEVW